MGMLAQLLVRVRAYDMCQGMLLVCPDTCLLYSGIRVDVQLPLPARSDACGRLVPCVRMPWRPAGVVEAYMRRHHVI